MSVVTTSNGLRDIVSGRAGTPTTLGTALTPKGRAWQFDGNTSLIDFGGLPPGLPDLTGTYTMAAWVMANSASPARTITQVCDATRNTHICYNPSNSYLGLESAASGSGLSVSVSSGLPYLVVGSATAGTPIDTYVNGVKGVNNGSSGIAASTQAGYTIGKRIGGTSMLGPLWLSVLWNRYLTVEEKLRFTRNPWVLFEPRKIFVGYSLAAGGGVSADGSLSSLSLSATTGSATGASTASGALSSLSLTALSGAATGAATSSGSLGALSLSSLTGWATGASAATSALQPVVLTAPEGSASGAGIASGALSELSITPATGTAFSGAGTVADGSLSQITLSSLTGGAAGSASASGMLQPIALSSPEVSASGRASCFGALPTISITPCGGSASTTAPASRASGSVFCRVGTPRAVVRVASTNCVVRMP